MQAPTFSGTPGKFKVYKITSPTVTSVYYGSTQNDLGFRYDDHKSGLKHNRHANRNFQFLYNSGIADWSMSFVDEFDTLKEARELEDELIAKDPHAINIIGKSFKPGTRRNPPLTADSIKLVRKLISEGKRQYEAAAAIQSNGCVVSHILDGYHDDLLLKSDLPTAEWWEVQARTVTAKIVPIVKVGKKYKFTDAHMEESLKLRAIGFSRRRLAKLYQTDEAGVDAVYYAAKERTF